MIYLWREKNTFLNNSSNHFTSKKTEENSLLTRVDIDELTWLVNSSTQFHIDNVKNMHCACCAFTFFIICSSTFRRLAFTKKIVRNKWVRQPFFSHSKWKWHPWFNEYRTFGTFECISVQSVTCRPMYFPLLECRQLNSWTDNYSDMKRYNAVCGKHNELLSIEQNDTGCGVKKLCEWGLIGARRN